jgi:TusA-related sulfurtransferase
MNGFQLTNKNNQTIMVVLHNNGLTIDIDGAMKKFSSEEVQTMSIDDLCWEMGIEYEYLIQYLNEHCSAE